MRLRPYKSSDASIVMNWLSDERTVALWKSRRFTYPLTGEQFERYQHEFEQDSHACIFTALDEEGSPVGHVSFREIDYMANTAYMGFIVVDPAARGRGYGKQMVSLALHYAFDLLGVSEVTLGVYGCNTAAQKCYELVGFHKIDRAPQLVKFHEETWEYRYMTVEKQSV